jgi:putative membrane protein
MKFLLRWFVCSLGIWIAAALLGEQSLSVGGSVGTVVGAGFVLAVVNIFLKPVIIILSLPAILFTLGLFMIVVNGLVVFIASKLYGPLHVRNLWAAIVAGMVIGLVNYLVTRILEEE